MPNTDVTEAEVDEAIENLREQQADFPDVEPARAAQMEDYVVVDYDGTIDGEPVHVKFPKAGKPLTHNADFWIKMTDEAFFPGFCQNLVGANVGRDPRVRRGSAVGFPGGRNARHEDPLQSDAEGREGPQRLPELNDEFADSIAKGKTLAELRDARSRRTRAPEEEPGGDGEAQQRDERAALEGGVRIAHAPRAPADAVASSRDIVRENQSRGVTEEVLKEHEQELVGSAAQSARERLKGNFILLRIAEQEKIRVTRSGTARPHQPAGAALRDELRQDAEGTPEAECARSDQRGDPLGQDARLRRERSDGDDLDERQPRSRKLPPRTAKTSSVGAAVALIAWAILCCTNRHRAF